MRCACRSRIMRRAFRPPERKPQREGRILRDAPFRISRNSVLPVAGSEQSHGDGADEQKRKPGRQISSLHRQHFSLHSLGEEDSRAEGARFASGFMAALQHGTGRVRRDFPNPLSPAGKCCVDEILSVPSEGHMTGVFSRFPVRLCIYHFGRVDQARNRMTGLPMLARSSRRCSTAGASSSG